RGLRAAHPAVRRPFCPAERELSSQVLRPVAAEGRNDAEGIVSQARAIGRRSRVRAIQGSTTCATLVVRRACCRASWHPEATCNQPTGGPRKLLALARGPH